MERIKSKETVNAILMFTMKNKEGKEEKLLIQRVYELSEEIEFILLEQKEQEKEEEEIILFPLKLLSKSLNDLGIKTIIITGDKEYKEHNLVCHQSIITTIAFEKVNTIKFDFRYKEN